MAPLSESAGHLAHKLANGSLTSEAYCSALLEREDKHRHLNAFATIDQDHLFNQARQADLDLKTGHIRGPLHGVPLILKDNINTFDLPTSGGTPVLKGNQPGSDAPIVRRLRDAGALIAGKANLHELSSGGTSANHTFGAVGNPYNATHVPGGSSGGTAAAIAARMVPAGLGTDTAGSVRVPASLCGLFGFRPTVGRYESKGIVPLSHSLDTAGPLATTIDDVILLDRVLAQIPSDVSEREAGTLRLGIAENLMARTEPGSSRVIEATLKDMEQAGVVLVAVDTSPMQDLQTKASTGVIDFEFEGMMRAYLDAFAPGITVDDVTQAIASPAVKAFTMERLEKVIAESDYRDAQTQGLKAFNDAWQQLFDDHALDAIAFPTTPEAALPLVEDDNVLRNGEQTFSWFYFQHTAMASIGRRPGITLPVGLNDAGLPVGLELDGLQGQDSDLLATARTVAALLDPLPAPRL